MARWFVDRSAQRGIPSVSLRRLLPEAQFVGCRDLEVTGCSADSRHIHPGQVFVAIRDDHRDGHDHIPAALGRGASAVIADRPSPEAGPLQVIVSDPRLALAHLSHALAGAPGRSLETLGIAGATGKTAASLFTRAILEAAGCRTGLVGPFSWSDGIEQHACGATPVEAQGLAEMLAEMVNRGCDSAVIEADEAALDRRGIAGLGLAAAAVTTLEGGATGSGLARRRSLAGRLARGVVAGGAVVVNADDREADLIGAVNLQARRVTFGMRAEADVSATVERLDSTGTRLRLRGFDREVTVGLRPVGSRVVPSALAAAALAWSLELPLEAVVEGLESVDAIPGRLEGVPGARAHDLDVWVDRARTSHELAAALAGARELATGRVFCVLGAEGLRDRAGRASLARAAELGADHLTLTTDNPRTEAPDQILDELLAGLVRPGRVLIELDRRLAIESTLALTEPGDALLIAGKGRATFQIFADRALPFDDRTVASTTLARLQAAHRRSA